MKSAVVLLFLLAASPALAGTDLSPAGVWEGSAYMHRFRIGCVRDRNATIRGVMLIDWWKKTPSPYHYTGQVDDDNDTFSARHHDGHWGQGKMLDDSTIEIIFTTRKGQTLTVRARRIPDMIPDAEGAPQPW